MKDEELQAKALELAREMNRRLSEGDPSDLPFMNQKQVAVFAEMIVFPMLAAIRISTARACAEGCADGTEAGEHYASAIRAQFGVK